MAIESHDAELIRQSAWLVRKECPKHAATTWEDLLQEGWLALLEASAAGRLPPPGPHRGAYVTRRAMGAMRDARWRANRSIPDAAVSVVPDQDTEQAEEMIDRVHVQEQLRRFGCRREATPLMRQTLDRLLAGDTIGEIAACRGCTYSAVLKVADRIDWLMAMLR